MGPNNISTKNIEFWDELCGTQLAKMLGIIDHSRESLARFDEWYFDFYPYLYSHIDFEHMRGCNVLEVGLGYGTVAQRLAESGAQYTGLDIAAGPVAMVNHRLHQNNLAGAAVQGSILDPPFESKSFDKIIAIGCLHHTGYMKTAIDNCYKLLRLGGSLIFMVYYAYSYRRWAQAPRDTLRYMAAEICGVRGGVSATASKQGAAYDRNTAGESPPHTEWISKKSLSALCSEFRSFKPVLENIGAELVFKKCDRQRLLLTRIPRLFGLDLYATATK